MPEFGRSSLSTLYTDKIYLDRANRDILLSRDSANKLSLADALKLGGDLDLNSQLMSNSYEALRGLWREALWHRVGSSSDAQPVTGSGSVSVQGPRRYCQTGTTHASSAGARRNVFVPGAGGQYAIDWAKKFWLACLVQWIGATPTNLTIRCLVTQSTAVESLAAHGLGMATSGADIGLVTYGANGSQARVSGATDLVTGDRVWILIEHDPASAVRLYVNGTLKATQSTAGDIPSTEPAAGYSIHCSIARSGGADAGNEVADFVQMYYGQEL